MFCWMEEFVFVIVCFDKDKMFVIFRNLLMVFIDSMD